jgi:hypothetical protein
LLQNLNLFFITVHITIKPSYNTNYISSFSNYWDILNFYSHYTLFYVNKSNFFYLDYYSQNLNNALTNSIAFFHPLLLYTYITFSALSYFFYRPNFFFYKTIDYSININIILYTLFLSSCWSSQEIFWNGFWNWDMVEISLINFVVIYIFFNHTKRNFSYYLIYKNYFLICMFFFISSNKTNLIFSQHSFSTSFLFKVDILLYFILISFFYIKLYRFLFNNSFYLIGFFYFGFLIIYTYYIFYKYKYNIKGTTTQIQMYFYLFFYFLFGYSYSNQSFYFTNKSILFNFKFKKKKNFLFLFSHYSYLAIILIIIDFSNSINFYFDYHSFFYKVFLIQNNLTTNLNSFFYNRVPLSFFKVHLNNSIAFYFINNQDVPFLYINSTNKLYLNKIKIQKKIKRFKKRRSLSCSYKSTMFNLHSNKTRLPTWSYVFSRLSMFIELKFYKFFIFKLRRLSRRKKFKSFVNICCNHCFSKKSKNSRMGKGKGKFVRYVYRSLPMKPIFSFYRMSKVRINKLVRLFNKKCLNNFWFF